jgi:hypothetical protein
MADYGRRLDDVRSALNWAFSPAGDTSLGIGLTVATVHLWLELSLLHECRERLERALAGLAAQADSDELAELHIRGWLGLVLIYVVRHLHVIGDHWARTLALAEKLGDDGARARSDDLCLIAADSSDAGLQMMGQGIAADTLHYLGNHSDAAHRILPLLRESGLAPPRALFAYRISARAGISTVFWVLGLPDQAFASANSRSVRRAPPKTRSCSQVCSRNRAKSLCMWEILLLPQLGLKYSWTVRQI